MENEKIRSYKVEGWIAAAYSIYCFAWFVFAFYGGQSPKGIGSLLHTATLVFFYFFMSKLAILFWKELRHKFISIFIVLGLFIYLFYWSSYTLVNIYLYYFDPNFLFNNPEWRYPLKQCYYISSGCYAVILALCGLYYLLLYHGIMKGALMLLGWVEIAYGIILFFHLRGTATIDLLATIESMVVAYFFLNFETEMNLEKKNVKPEPHPEVIDQL
jgi:hypothetical protein